MLKISEQWLSGLDKEKRDEIKSIVLGSTILLDRLNKILYNIKKEKSEVRLLDYDSPSWSHKQAHLNGQIDMLDQLVKLVSITERADQPTI